MVLWGGAVSAAPIASNDVRVIDGDTIRVHHRHPDVRLVGFNAPETRRANCPWERELGDKATRRLRDLVRSSQLDFEFVPCACPLGTEGTLVITDGVAARSKPMGKMSAGF
jgi:endonuclease YncB( thermonuclease family)